jgi:hypothetical protein
LWACGLGHTRGVEHRLAILRARTAASGSSGAPMTAMVCVLAWVPAGLLAVEVVHGRAAWLA